MCDTETPQGIAAVCRVLDVALDDGPRRPADRRARVRPHATSATRATPARSSAAPTPPAPTPSSSATRASTSTTPRWSARPSARCGTCRSSSASAVAGDPRRPARARASRLLAADGAGTTLLPDADLGRPHAWVMGNEAWGLAAGGPRRLRRRRPGPDPRPGRVAQPRHGRHDLPLRLRARPAARAADSARRGGPWLSSGHEPPSTAPVTAARTASAPKPLAVMGELLPDGLVVVGGDRRDPLRQRRGRCASSSCDASDLVGRRPRRRPSADRQVRPRLVGPHRPVGRPAAAGTGHREKLLVAPQAAARCWSPPRYVRSGDGRQPVDRVHPRAARRRGPAAGRARPGRRCSRPSPTSCARR